MSSGDLQHTALNGVGEYIEALDTLCGLTRHHLYIFENDFDQLGFNSEVRYNLLRRLLLSSPNARLHLLAHNTRPLLQFCPRMMMLLRQFSHNLHIYQTPASLHHLSEPFAVADENHFVRRFHFEDAHGMFAQNDPVGARQWKSQFEEMWSVSHPGVSASTLGL